MLKKLFVTAAVAAAVSVPLAGVAWGEPANDNPIGPGGLPERIAQVAGVQGTLVPPGRGTALPHADPDTDPELASGVSDIAELPDLSGRLSLKSTARSCSGDQGIHASVCKRLPRLPAIRKAVESQGKA